MVSNFKVFKKEQRINTNKTRNRSKRTKQFKVERLRKTRNYFTLDSHKVYYMNDLKKLTIVIIRIQALSILLVAIIQWVIILTGILIASLKTVPSQYVNYEGLLISSILYFVVSVIVWARSKSLAEYFISGLDM